MLSDAVDMGVDAVDTLADAVETVADAVEITCLAIQVFRFAAQPLHGFAVTSLGPVGYSTKRKKKTQYNWLDSFIGTAVVSARKTSRARKLHAIRHWSKTQSYQVENIVLVELPGGASSLFGEHRQCALHVT